MHSSTSRHGSFNKGLLALLFTGIAGAPILWLTALQTGYTLAYQACDERSTTWVAAPTFAIAGIIAVIAIACWLGHRRAANDKTPLPFLGELAVGLAVLMVIVMIASSLAPVMLQPCD